MPPHSLDFLSSELLHHLVGCIESQRDLNSLSRSSKTLYHHTVPGLYRQWSYHGLQEEVKPLRKFLETLNWRPDLAEYVTELDLREWGDCPRLKDGNSDPGVDGHERVRIVEKALEEQKEKEKGTMMDDDVFGDEDGSSDETYEADSDVSELEARSEDEEMESSGDGDLSDDPVDSDELEILGPIRPFSHEPCEKFKCTDNKYFDFKRAGRDFEREDILLDYADILEQRDEDKLIIRLLSSLPNLQALYMVMPDMSQEWEKDHLFRKLLEQSSESSARVLQKLNSLYICSPMYHGGHGHREYDLDLRNLIPFMRLPSLRSLYTLTAHLFWHASRPRSPAFFKDLKHTCNITTLCYDEAMLFPIDVLDSLGMFKGLKSFRWTSALTSVAQSTEFIGFHKSLGRALSAHKDMLEELYIDIRPQDPKEEGRMRCSADDILIGSLKEYTKMRTLSIDVSSLCGHQDWMSSPLLLIDVLPPNLESLKLFAKIAIVPHLNMRPMSLDNSVWVSNLEILVRHPPSALRKLSIKLIRDPPLWGTAPEPDMQFPVGFLESIRLNCEDTQIVFELIVEAQVNVDRKRSDGYTEIPYFLEQIRGRDPGRD